MRFIIPKITIELICARFLLLTLIESGEIMYSIDFSCLPPDGESFQWRQSAIVLSFQVSTVSIAHLYDSTVPKAILSIGQLLIVSLYLILSR